MKFGIGANLNAEVANLDEAVDLLRVSSKYQLSMVSNPCEFYFIFIRPKQYPCRFTGWNLAEEGEGEGNIWLFVPEWIYETILW